VSADDSSVIFESPGALTPEAVPGNAEVEGLEYNLYASVAGSDYLVNVLPNGQPAVNAAFGGVSQPGEEGEQTSRERPGYNHYGQTISAHGTRVFWTDLNTTVTPDNPTGATRLYVRLNPAASSASTVQVDAAVGGGGEYRGASSDGSRVFFTKARDLYEYDLATTNTTDLAPSGAVLGVSGISEDGAYVYFVSEAVLASNENGDKAHAAAGVPNLYLYHSGAPEPTRFIATLTLDDNAMFGPSANFPGEAFWGDWRAGLNVRTAEVTPDGRHLVFMSHRSLTGYNNDGGCENSTGQPAGCPEVFVYDANTDQLLCASCSSSGEPPIAAGAEPRTLGGAFLPTPTVLSSGAYQLRWINEDGSRVFFDSAEPLVPQDNNGVQDVYEWERNGSGSCRRDPSCTYLISSDLSDEEATLVDASASGDDVFFASRAQLVPEDRSQFVELYDARVGGGFPTPSLACTGTGCQGVPQAPPSFATPASVTFTGAGNFPPTPTKSPPKPLTRAQKLARALKACKSKARKRRARCKREARARYGAKSAGKSKTSTAARHLEGK
jgi:hypothetical protein